MSFAMADRRNYGGDDVLTTCDYPLGEFLRLDRAAPDAAPFPQRLKGDDAAWRDGKSIDSKGCMAKRGVHTCGDESNGFQFVVSALWFSSPEGCPLDLP